MTDLRQAIIRILALNQELWGKLAQSSNPEIAVDAWMLLCADAQPDELIAAWTQWAKTETYPPRPGDLLALVTGERIRQRELERHAVWRAAGRPIAIGGEIIYLDDQVPELEGTPRRIPALEVTRAIG